MQGLLHLQHTPAVRPAPSWRGVPCASRSSRGPRLTAHPAPARTRGHPWPRPAAPARTLAALRCSADLRGPRFTNPPSMAGCYAVPTALLRVLASVHARSVASASIRRPAMDGGFLEWGPSEPPSIAGRSGSRPRRGRGHGWPRVGCVRRMRTRRTPEGPRSAGNRGAGARAAARRGVLGGAGGLAQARPLARAAAADRNALFLAETNKRSALETTARARDNEAAGRGPPYGLPHAEDQEQRSVLRSTRARSGNRRSGRRRHRARQPPRPHSPRQRPRTPRIRRSPTRAAACA